MDTRGTAVRGRLARRAVASAGVLALGAAAMVAVAVPASAASTPVDDVTLTWSINNEVGGGAFFGGCNFLSAGAAGNAGSSRLWTQADGFYQTQVGNVTVEKPDASGAYAQPTWATKCQNPSGTAVTSANTNAGNFTQNRVVFADGTGDVDLAAGTASVSWDGDLTVVFYGGLTYWTASDPVLTVAADGTGTLTATASGYGADMVDTSTWVALTPQTITLATLHGVELTDGGLTVTPDYLGVAIDAGTGTAQPAQTSGNAAYWGSFPQDFVDFQYLTGQSSYWYTSGGSRDAAKPANPLTVAWDVETPPEPTNGSVTVSTTTPPASGVSTVVVTGTGFDPSLAVGTRPPLPGQPTGLYVAFGRYDDDWKPSDGAPSSARHNGANDSGALLWVLPAASRDVLDPDHTNPAYAVLGADGTFSVTLTVDASLFSGVTGNYGIYTYAAGGPVVAQYETYTPLTFVDGNGVPVVVTIPETGGPEPEPGELTWSVAAGGASLGTATATGAGFTASGTLPTVTVTDTRTAEGANWTVNGRVGDFTASGGASGFGGQALGWLPTILGGDAEPGATVAPGTATGSGLSAVSSTLATGDAGGQSAQPVTVSAGLSLLAPSTTPQGSYTATLTLTTVG